LALAKMDISTRADNPITLWFILLIGIMAAVAMALAFEIPLREWLSFSAAAYAISLIAGVLVGAFFGLYTTKRIVERLAHR
jgi:F0F1-type ATP synthase assembly protein I